MSAMKHAAETESLGYAFLCSRRQLLVKYFFSRHRKDVSKKKKRPREELAAMIFNCLLGHSWEHKMTQNRLFYKLAWLLRCLAQS